MPEVENKPKKGFFKNIGAELKKVIWPSGKQVVKSTAATIAFVLLIAAIIILLNLVFDELSSWWINLI